jgi:plasmid stabilization system protein ParE
MAKAKVIWRERAAADIARLRSFLSDKDTKASQRAMRVIYGGGELLATHPKLGRPIDDGSHRRELYLAFGSGFYIIRYFADANDTVVIVRVWHSKENRNY